MKPTVIDPKTTTRAEAYALWISASNPIKMKKINRDLIRELYMKKIVLFVAACVIIVGGLTGCSVRKYKSHWNAVAFVHSNTSQKANMSFSSFEGTIVYELNCKGENEVLHYSSTFGSGSAEVFYDNSGEKVLMFSVKDGSDGDGFVRDLQKGKIYIIIEATEKCTEGQFKFEVINESEN